MRKGIVLGRLFPLTFFHSNPRVEEPSAPFLIPRRTTTITQKEGSLPAVREETLLNIQYPA